MTPTELVQGLEKLCGIAEQQVLAARSLDGERLDSLNVERADLQFEIQIVSENPPELDADQRAALLQLVEKLARLDDRLAAVTGTVVDALQTVLPSKRSAPVYGRNGLMRRG